MWLIGAVFAMPGMGIGGLSLSYLPCFFVLPFLPKAARYFPKGIVYTLALSVASLISEIFFPTKLSYLENRYRALTNQINTKFATTVESENLILWLKFSVALFGGVIIVTLAYSWALEANLIKGFLMGSTLSVITSLFTLKPGEGDYLQSFGLGRTTTTFGMICSYSIALVFHEKLKFGTRLKMVLLLIHVVGILMSGSRGAAITGAVATFFVLIWRQKASRFIWLMWVGLFSTLILFASNSSVLGSLGVRALSQSQSVLNSSLIRELLRNQALLDWRYDPFGGIGFSVLTQGHNTYLQTLAAGGLAFFIGYILLDIQSIRIALQVQSQKNLSYIPAIVFCTIFNHFTQNQIDIPFLYLILGIVFLTSSVKGEERILR